MPEPIRCLRCGYILDGLPEPRCPECGQAFSFSDPTTYYTTRLPFVWWRYWLPGFLLATIMGTVIYAVLVQFWGYGWAAAVVTPFCMGAAMGYGLRVRSAIQVLLITAAVAILAISLRTGGIAGFFCALIIFGVAAGGALIGGLFGVLLGYLLREKLKKTRFGQRDWLPMLLILLIPLAWGPIEGRHVYANETIETSIVMPSSAAEAWDGVMFYEEVHHRPPALLRWLLPRPLYTTGGTQRVGDVKYCVYSKGRLVKRITRREEGKLLSFDVIEQTKIETRSVRLTSGEFRFEPLGPNETRVTLATRYQPLLGPRFEWRWAEEWATHTLHRHVLEGMAMKARGEQASP